MGKEEIIGRILSDAESEAQATLDGAHRSAEEILARAEERIGALKRETAEDVAARSKRIADGKAAAARLDSAKVLLAQKRRVLDAIYSRALERLNALPENETLALLERLLREHAERGDEVLFARNCAFAARAAALPAVRELGLTVSKERAQVSGGFVLRGKLCDKDVSYAALLEADREEMQSALAARIFR